MKTSKTLLAILFLSLGTVANASPKTGKIGPVESEKVEIVTKDQGLYNLVYKTNSAGTYKVRILDKSGQTIFNESFTSASSFSKTYNFKEMAYGHYTIEIINGKSKEVKEIIHEPSSSVFIDINSVSENQKINLLVKGLREKPVKVIIYDSENKTVYENMILEKSSFSQVFDLSKLPSKNVNFQVIYNGQIIEKKFQL